MKKQYYFISDLHIGGDSVLDYCDFEEELIGFLRNLEKFDKNTELILVGDTFGFWEIVTLKGIDKLTRTITNHQDVFDQFKITGDKIKITVIPGNHDHELISDIEFKRILKNYNIILKPYKSLIRKIGSKKIRIEHGNQYDIYNYFADWNDTDYRPFGYFITENILYKIAKQLVPNSGKWISDFPSVKPESVPIWFVSNYYFREMNPILRYFSFPFLFLLTFSFLILILMFLQKFQIISYTFLTRDFAYYFGFFGNVIDKIIFINIVFIVSLLVIALPVVFFIYDFSKAINKYGFKKLKFRRNIRRNQINGARKLFDKHQDLAIAVFGHKHNVYLFKENNRVVLNTGTWLKRMKKIKTWVRFIPPVYVPSYELSIFKVYEEQKDIIIEYTKIDKNENHKFTFLEKIFVYGKKTKDKVNIPQKTVING